MAYGRITADLRAQDATDEALVRASTHKLDEPAFA
jgi:erythritol transport system ATP-binding protein